MTRSDFDPRAAARFVEAALAGDSEALDELARKLARVPAILAQRNARTGAGFGPDELEDAAQDACLIVLRKLGAYRPLAPLESWIYGVCCLVLRDRVRRRAQHAAMVIDTDEAELAAAEPDSLDDQAEVETLLQRLGGVEADVIRLHHLEGLSFSAVGRRLARPLGTVKSHYYRGMARLRLLLHSTRKEVLDGRS